ncbi:MAG: hypothetical protein IKU34_07280 [Clostridia bacterium]|nr:hypothetical protein [Clostridia bacterium]
MHLPFQGKIDRAHKFQKEQKAQRGQPSGYDEELSPSDVMEKGDGCAMAIAALITFVPVALVALAAMCAVGYFFLIR